MISRYSVGKISKIFLDKNKYETWLKIEKSVLNFFVTQKIITSDVCKRICSELKFDYCQIAAEEVLTKHDFVAFLNVITKSTKLSDKKWIHYGLTTTDVVDTANSILIKEVNELLLKKINELLDALETIAYEHKNLAQVGRTHGVHAEITSFGYKFALFYDDIKRNVDIFYQVRRNIECAMISGSVGTFANTGIDLQDYVAKEFGLFNSHSSTQVLSRERYADYLHCLNMFGQTINKIASYLRLLNTTEINEINESFNSGQVGSSSMPHKKNPITLENICGLSRLLSSYAHTSLQNIPLWAERDISHSSVERVIIPDATTVLYNIVDKLTKVLVNMKVNKKEIAANILISNGKIYSQSAMLRIIKNLNVDRGVVHNKIQSMVRQSEETGLSFRDALLADEISSCLKMQDIEDIFSNKYHLSYINSAYKKIFKNHKNLELFESIIWDKNEITNSIYLLAERLNAYYKDIEDEVMVLAFLDGATVFVGHLLPLLTFNVRFMTLKCSFYGKDQLVNQNKKIDIDLNMEDYKNKRVLLLDDLIDVGKTLNEVKAKINTFMVKEIKVAVLFKKATEKKALSTVDWFGLLVPNKWIAGFGLDSNYKYRNIDFVGVLKGESY